MEKDNIPKVIHYCWFGESELSDLAVKCIESWRSKLPSYKIVKWDENNFDIRCNKYVYEAYCEKKWAFISDYVRLYVLYKYGGIYMDTDVEVLKDISCFLDNEVFTGFQDERNIPTGIIGAKKNNKWIFELLSYYDNRSFYLENRKNDLTTNVESITKISKKLGFDDSLQEQIFAGGVYIYPRDYFCAKSYLSGDITLTENTYCIHHFQGSWVDKGVKDIARKYLIKIIGENIYKKLSAIKVQLFYK